MTLKQRLFAYLALWEESDLSDGAYMAHLQDLVNQFNSANGTSFDSFESTLEYLGAEEHF